jgi:hypothetical protein
MAPEGKGGRTSRGVERRKRERERARGGWVCGWAVRLLVCGEAKDVLDMRNGAGPTTFCRKGSSSCWSSYSGHPCCIFGMQQEMHTLLEMI